MHQMVDVSPDPNGVCRVRGLSAGTDTELRVKVRRKLVQSGADGIAQKRGDGNLPFRFSPDCTVLDPRNLPSLLGVEGAAGTDKASGTETTERKLQQHNYCVIGSGKTAIDSLVYMVDGLKINPDQIFWFRPTIRWYMNGDIGP